VKRRTDSMTDPNLLAACGLYCGACYHYRASFPEGRHLLEEAAYRGRSLEGYTCRGCRSDTLYIHPGCARCQIRVCAEERGILHCGLCEAFPCARLSAFQGDGRVHHIPALEQLADIRRKGIGQWLAEQAGLWTCTCGMPFSWYETVCRNCDAPLDSYGPDPAPTQLKADR
jgi:hypothetical protein